MLVWTIYDISDNRIRTKVSEKCKDYGLKRLQKSAFFGELDRNSMETFAVEFEDIVGDDLGDKDCIFILPMCSSCIGKKITVGKGFDENQFKDRFYHLFG